MADFLPSKESLESLIALSNHSPEAAYYFATRFRQQLQKQRLVDKFNDLLVAIDTFCANVAAEWEMQVGDPWSGVAVKTSAELQAEQALLQQPTAMPTEAEKSAMVAVDLAVEVEENSKWERYYTSALDPAVKTELDALFKSWLDTRGMVRKNHIMYMKDAEGQPLQTVPAQALKAEFDHEQTGFAAYVQQASAGRYAVNLVVRLIAPSVQPSEAIAAPEGPASSGNN